MIRPTSKRKIQARKTREKVLNSALALFEERGFQNVSMEMIAEKADTSVGTIYHYFSGKEEIAARTVSILDERYEEFYYRLLEDEAYVGLSPLEKLEELFVFVHICCAEQSWLNFGYIYDLKNGSGVIVPVNEKRILYQCYVKLLKLCREAGVLSDAQTDEEMIMVLTQMSRGLLVDWMIQGKQFDLEKQSRKLIRIMIKGMQ